jgi:hypothetical protein
MNFQQVWNRFHELIRVEDVDSIDNRKIEACNAGYLMLLELMSQYSTLPEDLKVVGYGIDINLGANYVTLPSDYYNSSRLFVLNTDYSLYNQIKQNQIFLFDKLQDTLGGAFFDTTDNIGMPSQAAFLGTSKLYFNCYSSYYNELQFATITGDFTGETEVTVAATDIATVNSWNSTTKKMGITVTSGDFAVGDTVTGTTTGAFGVLTGVVLNDGIKLDYFKIPTTLTNTGLSAQTIELGNGYLNVLSLAFAVQWLFMEDAAEGEAKQQSLIELIKGKSSIEQRGTRYRTLSI